MDNQTVIARVTQFQQLQFGHPLTCGVNSRHSILKAEERDGKVVLFCPDCSYTQNWVPDILLTDGFDEVVKADIRMQRRLSNATTRAEKECL